MEMPKLIAHSAEDFSSDEGKFYMDCGEEGVNAMATILIVDDDRQICALLKQALGEQGYTVESALNGFEGIKGYRSHPADLIILDILMPEKEGLETILDTGICEKLLWQLLN